MILPAGKTIILDTNVTLRDLQIDGTVICADDKDLAVTAAATRRAPFDRAAADRFDHRTSKQGAPLALPLSRRATHALTPARAA